MKFCIEFLQKKPSIYGMVYSDPFAIFSFFIGIVWTDIRCMSHRIIYTFFILQKHADRRLISDTPGLAVRPFAVCISIVEFYHLPEEVFANFTARSDPALQFRKRNIHLFINAFWNLPQLTLGGKNYICSCYILR